MQTIKHFLSEFSKESPNYLPFESILCTIPSDSIVVDGESPDPTEQSIAFALGEIGFGDELSYDSAPGFTVSSSEQSIVYRITESSGAQPVYVITNSMSLA